MTASSPSRLHRSVTVRDVRAHSRARRSALHGETPLQAAPSTVVDVVRGPGMRPVDRPRGSSNRRRTPNWNWCVMEEAAAFAIGARVVDGAPSTAMADEGDWRHAGLSPPMLKASCGAPRIHRLRQDRRALGDRASRRPRDRGSRQPVPDQDVVAGEGLLLARSGARRAPAVRGRRRQAADVGPEGGRLPADHSRDLQPQRRPGRRPRERLLRLGASPLPAGASRSITGRCRSLRSRTPSCCADSLPSWIAGGPPLRSMSSRTHEAGWLLARSCSCRSTRAPTRRGSRRR